MISNKGCSQAQVAAEFPASVIGAGHAHIGVFKGTMPDLNKLFDIVASSPSVSMLSAVSILGIDKSDFLGSMVLPTMTPIVNVNSRTITLPLSGSANMLNVIADGTPTWFMYRRLLLSYDKNEWVGFTLNSSILGAMIGTIGPEGSGEELQYTGGALVAGQAYRVLDLTFQL